MDRINLAASLSHLANQPKLTIVKTGVDEKLTVAQVIRENKEVYLQMTEEEKADALLYGIKKKAVKLQAQEDEKRKIERIELIKKMWTAEECRDFAFARGKDIGKQRGFQFVVDKDNEEVFNLLSLYFSNDHRFEEHEYFGKKYSLQKGICLLSPVRGNGKTTLLDCFMWNKRGCFGKKSTKVLWKEANAGGITSIERFMWLVPAASSAANFFQDRIGFHYDDFGDENELVQMGNRIMISPMIINCIYDEHRDENKFWRFHISMNYKWSEFEKKYGTNSKSRMEEMFNLIPVPGESRR